MGVMLRRMERSGHCAGSTLNFAEPGIGEPVGTRQKGKARPPAAGRSRMATIFCASATALRRASARFCRVRCSGGCSFAFLCLDGGGPWPEGINGLARNQHI